MLVVHGIPLRRVSLQDRIFIFHIFEGANKYIPAEQEINQRVEKFERLCSPSRRSCRWSNGQKIRWKISSFHRRVSGDPSKTRNDESCRIGVFSSVWFPRGLRSSSTRKSHARNDRPSFALYLLFFFSLILRNKDPSVQLRDEFAKSSYGRRFHFSIFLSSYQDSDKNNGITWSDLLKNTVRFFLEELRSFSVNE